MTLISHTKRVTERGSFELKIDILCQEMILLTHFLEKESIAAQSNVVRSTRLWARNKAMYVAFTSHTKRVPCRGSFELKTHILCQGVILPTRALEKELRTTQSIVVRTTRLGARDGAMYVPLISHTKRVSQSFSFVYKACFLCSGSHYR